MDNVGYRVRPGDGLLISLGANRLSGWQSAVKVMEGIPAGGASLYQQMDAEAAWNTLPDLPSLQ